MTDVETWREKHSLNRHVNFPSVSSHEYLDYLLKEEKQKDQQSAGFGHI